MGVGGLARVRGKVKGIQKYKLGASSQNGGIGRQASPHCPTIRMNATNLKRKKQAELPENHPEKHP